MGESERPKRLFRACYTDDMVVPCAVAIKRYDEAFARLLHCASYGSKVESAKGL